MGLTLLIVTLLPYGKLQDLIFMEDDPKKDPDNQQRKGDPPTGDAPPVVNGNNKPIDKQESPDDSGGGANKPPTQNDDLTKPEGADSKKEEWRKDYRLKIITLVVSTLALAGTIWALYNTTKTMNANREQFEVSNRPFIELANLRIDSTREGQKPITSYTLSNKGRFPALVTEFRIFTGLAGKDATPDTIIHSAERDNPNNRRTDIGLIPFSPSVIQQASTADTPLTKDMIDAVNRGDFSYYMLIEIKYENLITKVRYSYIQGERIKMSPSIFVTSFKYADEPDSSK